MDSSCRSWCCLLYLCSRDACGRPCCSTSMRAQMSGWQGAQALHAEGGSAVAYTGMMDCLVRTVKEEGVRALFKVASAPNLPSLTCR